MALVYIIGEYGHLLAPGPFFHEGHLLDGNVPTPEEILFHLCAMLSSKEVDVEVVLELVFHLACSICFYCNWQTLR